MSFRFFDHTGDIGVRLQGRTPDDLFQAAVSAFGDAITDPARIEARERRVVELPSAPLDLLLVDFLDEMLYLFDAKQFLVREAEVRLRADGAAWALQATLVGEPLDAVRHPIKVLIKGVTYHALSVTEQPDGWHATVVFDI